MIPGKRKTKAFPLNALQTLQLILFMLKAENIILEDYLRKKNAQV